MVTYKEFYELFNVLTVRSGQFGTAEMLAALLLSLDWYKTWIQGGWASVIIARSILLIHSLRFVHQGILTLG